jgi:hypothetical protein
LDMYCRILLLGKQVGNIRQLSEEKVRELLEIKKKLGIGDPRIDDGIAATLAGSDEFLRGFSQRAIVQHVPDSNGHGRGMGIAGAPSQAGQPQPMPARAIQAIVAGRKLPAVGLGASSKTARMRAIEDETDRLVQLVTDKIVQIGAKK